jgi:hypothetical protein
MMAGELPAEVAIPRNILQFWHDKAVVPPEMHEAMEGTRAHNRSYRIHIFDDEGIAALLVATDRPDLLELFRLVRLPSSRSDIARLVILERYGGFYLDASMQFHVSLDAFLEGNPELILVRRDDFPQYADCPEQAHVMGGIIGAPPRSPFIRECIRRLVACLMSGELNTRAWDAGPGLINQTLRTHQPRGLVRKLSFRQLLDGSLSYRRSPGVSNIWVERQKQGIIDPALYAAGPLVLGTP